MKRKVLALEAGELDDERAERAPVPKNTDSVREVVRAELRVTNGKATAKRMLPMARTAGYPGSDRNFRRLVEGLRKQVRAEIGRYQRRPAVWVPGETVTETVGGVLVTVKVAVSDLLVSALLVALTL